ncbi:hypothetical protein GWI33_019786 [Rhynchophorus ferrugineus]|uniref:Uncharacterized protein n=1 Tax=Rhynchophorus ferrugineus TaxID=354439 RepID=A0A834I4P0_RHYFE|nr:hypothetical protein GWI33_019786 [Rhynchophorus ferrugineus]
MEVIRDTHREASERDSDGERGAEEWKYESFPLFTVITMSKQRKMFKTVPQIRFAFVKFPETTADAPQHPVTPVAQGKAGTRYLKRPPPHPGPPHSQ